VSYPSGFTAAETGYFTGAIQYYPSWSPTPISISIGTGPDPVYGISWIWEQIQGWDTPDVAGTVLQRGADHGGWPAGQWYGPRPLTLQLRASCPSQAARDTARMLMQQVIPPSDVALLQYNEPIPKQCYFRRGGKVTETYDNLSEVDFGAILMAPDPRKYSQAIKTWPVTSYVPVNYNSVGLAGSSTTTIPWTLASNPPPGTSGAVNAGNFETRPVVLIWGPLHSPGVIYQNTGQVVTYSQVTLNPGDVMAIDFDTRMGYINPNYFPVPGGPPLGQGQSSPLTISGYVPADVTSSWFVLYPGFNTVQLMSGQTVVSDAGQMVCYHRDAYM
jgi:hypothetical protein